MGSRVSRSTWRTSGAWLGHSFSTMTRDLSGAKQTSFRYLGKGETGASLEINIIGVNEGAKGAKRFANEEVRLPALR